MKNKEELESEKARLKLELSQVEDQIKHVDLPFKIREMVDFEIGKRLLYPFSLETRLGKEGAEKFSRAVVEFAEDLIKMIPHYDDTPHPCWKCQQIKNLYWDLSRYDSPKE